MNLAITLQLAFKIAIVWAGGFILATVVNAVLPNHAGLHFSGAQGGIFVPFNRLGFWTCLLAAVTVTAMVVFRGMMADFGGR